MMMPIVMQDAELELCTKPRQAMAAAVHGKDVSATDRFHWPAAYQEASDATVRGWRHWKGLLMK